MGSTEEFGISNVATIIILKWITQK
jgi:hypothetical protein